MKIAISTIPSCPPVWKRSRLSKFTSPLVIIGEKSPSRLKAKGLLDRMLVFTVYPGNSGLDIKEVVNPQGDPYRTREYNRLIAFRKLMLIYRLIHFKDPIPDIDINVQRRNKELCKPCIQLFYGTSVQGIIEQSLFSYSLSLSQPRFTLVCFLNNPSQFMKEVQQQVQQVRQKYHTR